ncbi:MAG: hypothetical protein KGL36_13590 [Gammaproteobacteria bacterium]|nr:hypothetical protein [Gammaproteobacteria bacterium]
MSAVRPGSIGTTRVCPHCKATVLASASICPGCRHHLRFNAGTAADAPATRTALRIEGTIGHDVAGESCEYCVVVSISNQHGEKIARQVVGVGALPPGERHSYSFSVELMPVRSGPDRRKA